MGYYVNRESYSTSMKQFKKVDICIFLFLFTSTISFIYMYTCLILKVASISSILNANSTIFETNRC